MPWITIETLEDWPSERRARVAAALTEAMGAIMGKRREVTALRFARARPGSWFVNGRAVAGEYAAVDIKITRGTNTVTEKAALLRVVRDALRPVVEPSYVVIDEVDADAWGYGGVSQEARRHAGPAKP